MLSWGEDCGTVTCVGGVVKGDRGSAGLRGSLRLRIVDNCSKADRKKKRLGTASFGMNSNSGVIVLP